MTKNRRIIVIAFVLVAMLALGVGFAAVADDLSITANLASPSWEPNVFISAVGGDVDSNTTIGKNTDEVTVTLNKNLFNKGQTAEFTVTFKNTNAFAITVNTSDEAKVSTTDFTVTPDQTAFEIAANSEVTVKYTVLLNTDVSKDALSAVFTVGYEAAPTVD
jgi:hypothetical protein